MVTMAPRVAPVPHGRATLRGWLIVSSSLRLCVLAPAVSSGARPSHAGADAVREDPSGNEQHLAEGLEPVEAVVRAPLAAGEPQRHRLDPLVPQRAASTSSIGFPGATAASNDRSKHGSRAQQLVPAAPACHVRPPASRSTTCPGSKEYPSASGSKRPAPRSSASLLARGPVEALHADLHALDLEPGGLGSPPFAWGGAMRLCV